ncbi:MAG: YCF48-related protein [Bacteroidota bacterium]
MRKVIISFLFAHCILFGQWKPVPFETQRSLYSVQFYDTSVGIISGASGLVARTADGGKSWQSYLDILNLYPDLYSVSLHDSSGWVGGRSGALLKTTDKGISWEPQYGFASSIGGFYLSQVIFINDSIGWMSGNYKAIFRTKFGDGYWTSEYITKDPIVISYFYTKDCISGYLVGGDGTAYKTTNSGITATKLNVGVTTKLENVTFVDDSTGWIVGSAGTILKTIDAGNTWSKYDTIFPNNLNWITFVNKTDGWIVGSGGLILKTTDAGNMWNVVPSGTLASLRSVYFANEQFGCIVGDSGKVFMYDTSYVLSQDSSTVLSMPNGTKEQTAFTFSLEKNYPNPFNPSTTISFSIPAADRVQLKVYDAIGREIRTLADGYFSAGKHSVEFHAGSLSSGTYICRLTSGVYSSVQKMILAK